MNFSIMEKPLVNVIVRTKDRPELLMEALKSIADQCYRPVKPVIINDGGVHIEEREILSILQDMPFIYVEHQQNQGRSAALNSGLDNCDGEFIYFLDDDDLAYEQGISSLVDASLKSGNVPAYGKVSCTEYKLSPGREDDKDSEPASVSQISEETVELNKKVIYTKELGEPFDSGKLVFENYIATNSLLVPSKIAQEVGRFDEAFEIFEDWDWILRMASLCEPLFTDNVIAEYRACESSTLAGKGGADYHRKYKSMLLEKHRDKITPDLILDYVQRSVDTAVLEKAREINLHKDMSLKFQLESEHYLNETLLLKDEIELYKEDLANHRVEIERYHEDLVSHKREIEQYQTELKHHKEHITWQQDNISRVDNELKHYQEHLQLQNGHIQLQNSHINALGDTIQSHNVHIAALEHDLHISKTEIQTLNNLLNERGMELEDLKRSNEAIVRGNIQLSEDVRNTSEQFLLCKNDLTRMSKDMERLHEEFVHRSSELESVYSSLSWRITEPLRRSKTIAMKKKCKN